MTTTQTTHTPGPWTLTVHPDTQTIIGQGVQVAFAGRNRGTGHTISLDEAKANARLIAAAPAMLAALEAAVMELEITSLNVHKDEQVRQGIKRNVDNVIPQVRAAIEAAR